MVGFRFFKRRFVVAGGAVGRELAAVGIGRVARPAGFAGDLVELPVLVALGALERRVLALQSELRLGMAGRAGLPGRVVVALGAGFSEGGQVRVLMAVGAGAEFQPFPLFRRMALQAGDAPVRSLGAISGPGMIEVRLFQGPVDGMADRAIAGAELAFVRIVVAARAARILDQVGDRRLRRRSGPDVVALEALPDGRVLPGQGRAGLGVVEGPGIPVDQPEVRPLMIGVAGRAAALFILMESPAGGDPGGQVFVAGQTFFLDRLGSGRMALAAARQVGEVGVGAAELPGRNEEGCFLGGQRGCSRPKEQEGQDSRPDRLPRGDISLFRFHYRFGTRR